RIDGDGTDIGKDNEFSTPGLGGQDWKRLSGDGRLRKAPAPIRYCRAPHARIPPFDLCFVRPAAGPAGHSSRGFFPADPAHPVGELLLLPRARREEARGRLAPG